MLVPDFPTDETARLEKLNSLAILDTQPEERFDRVTRLARRIFGVPIAVVSLVDANRQWFKSNLGLDASETPREVSFCGHAILGDNIFAIEDALQDPRFSDNPLVTGGPKIRFYAGYPLRVTGNSRIGTLCLYDRRPREFSDHDRASLRDLGGMVEDELIALKMATLDELTQISNRRGILILGKNTLRLASRLMVTGLLFYFDLDRFKSINDGFGHAEGDLALQNFSTLLIETFREADVIARLGGDEFAVLCTNCTADESESLLARFRERTAELNRNAARGYDLSYSVGMLPVDPAKCYSISTILAQADALMYARKQIKRAQNLDQL